MGLFDTISNVFFEEEQPPVVSANKGARNPSPGPTVGQGNIPVSSPGAPSSKPVTHYSSNPGIDQKIAQKFNSSLLEALEKENLPGFDFYEFHQLYNRFLKDGKSELEAINTAISSAETMRVDKNTLISNFHHYKKILDEQKIIFEKDLKEFFDSNIKSPKQSFVDIDKSIKEKENQIKQFTRDIENLKKDQVNLGIDVEKAEQQIEKVGAAFEHAYQIVHNDILTLNEKLKRI